MASQFPGLIEYIQKNPLLYKTVKDFKKICSNRKTYYVIKRMLLEQQRKNNRHFSTYVKPKNNEIVV